MIRNFDEVPDTIEALRFYIRAGGNALKDFKNKAERMEILISEAKRKLKE